MLRGLYRCLICDIGNLLTDMMTVKTWSNLWREHLSKVPDNIKCEHLPTQASDHNKVQSGQDPDEVTEHANDLPWDNSDQILCLFKPIVATAVWVAQIILEVKLQVVEVLGCCCYMWSVVVSFLCTVHKRGFIYWSSAHEKQSKNKSAAVYILFIVYKIIYSYTLKKIKNIIFLKYVYAVCLRLRILLYWTF